MRPLPVLFRNNYLRDGKYGEFVTFCQQRRSAMIAWCWLWVRLKIFGSDFRKITMIIPQNFSTNFNSSFTVQIAILHLISCQKSRRHYIVIEILLKLQAAMFCTYCLNSANNCINWGQSWDTATKAYKTLAESRPTLWL